MQTVARPAPRPRLPAPARSSLPSQLWRLPLAWHAAALAGVLLLTWALIAPNHLSNADEGAALSQAELLLRGDGWSTPHPLPAVDPGGEAFPIDNSARVAATDEFVPFAKHPAYPLLLVPFIATFGAAGGLLLSMAGTVAASVAAALMSARLDRNLARPTLWFTGVATPLWFDSFLTIAHTLGAALVGFGVLVLLRPDARWRGIVGGSALLASAVLVRNEAILLGAALAIVLLVTSALHRCRRDAVLGVATLAAIAVGYLVDGRLEAFVLGGATIEPFAISEDVGFVEGRWSAFAYTVLAPSNRTPLGLLLGTLATTLVIAAVITARRRPSDSGGIVLLLGGALAAHLARWMYEPNAYIPGLVVAAPLVIAALVVLDRTMVARREISVLTATCGLFFLSVVATQYSNGGGGGWGGRYFAIGLPLITPVAMLSLVTVGRALRPAARAATLVLAAGLTLVITLAGSWVMLIDHRMSRSLEETLAAVTAGLDPGDGDARPVVVSTRPGLGRIAYRSVLDQRWIEMPGTDDDIGPYLQRLEAQGVRRVVVVTQRVEEDAAAAARANYRIVSEHAVVADDPLGRRLIYSPRVLVVSSQSEG